MRCATTGIWSVSDIYADQIIQQGGVVAVPDAVYQIVRIGGSPVDECYSEQGAACAEWSLLSDKSDKEVIAVNLATGEVSHRYSPADSERIAQAWRNPKIR